MTSRAGRVSQVADPCERLRLISVHCFRLCVAVWRRLTKRKTLNYITLSIHSIFIIKRAEARIFLPSSPYENIKLLKQCSFSMTVQYIWLKEIISGKLLKPTIEPYYMELLDFSFSWESSKRMAPIALPFTNVFNVGKPFLKHVVLSNNCWIQIISLDFYNSRNNFPFELLYWINVKNPTSTEENM